MLPDWPPAYRKLRLSMYTIRTIIADDHRIFVEGLQQLLLASKEFRFKISGIAYDGHQALRQIKHRKAEADLLLLDLKMPGQDGLEVLKSLGVEKQQLKIIILSGYNDPRVVLEAFKAGADGYLLKKSSVEELFTAIREVLEGNRFLGEGVELPRPEESHPAKTEETHRTSSLEDKFILKYNLTKREKEVLQLITKAKSNREIARLLFISEQTVGVHRKNLMRKLGVSNTAGLIKLVVEHSLI